MNKGIIAAGVLAGTAGLAVGQITVTFTADVDTAQVGTDSINYTVDITNADPSRNLTLLDVLDFNASLTGNATDMNFDPSAVSAFSGLLGAGALQGGIASGADLLNIDGTSGGGPGVAAGSSLTLGTFSVVASQEGFLTYSLFSTGIDSAGSGFADATNTPFTDITVVNANNGGDGVNVVPTPGAAAILGLGGLVAARRRR